MQHHLLSILKTTVYVNVMLMATFPYATGSHCRQVTIFPENVRFGNMRIITWISKVSWLPMASSTSPFTYEAVDVIFGSIYFHFHIQTAPNLQDCPYSDNLPTFPDSTLFMITDQYCRKWLSPKKTSFSAPKIIHPYTGLIPVTILYFISYDLLPIWSKLLFS